MQTVRRFFSSFWGMFQRRGVVGKVGIGCSVLIALACLCSLPVVVLAPPSTSTPESRAAGFAAEETLVPKTTESADVPEPTVPKDDWEITVTDMQRFESLPWQGKPIKPEGDSWLVVYMDVKNVSSSREALTASDFELFTGSEKIDIDGDATGAAGDAAGIEATVAGFGGVTFDAGETKREVVAFDLPGGLDEVSVRARKVEFVLGGPQEMAYVPDPTATSTAEATETPVSTETPVPSFTSEASSANAGESYVIEAQTYTGAIGTALSSYAGLLQEPHFLDETWVADVKAEFGIVQAAHEKLVEMEVPEGWDEVHAALLDAEGDCVEATEHASDGVDKLDADEMDMANRLFVTCTSKMEVAIGLLEAKMGGDATRTGEVATEVPLSCLGSAYMADVTVPDNTEFDTGGTFLKTWRVRNSGSCVWPEDTVLAFVSGDKLDGATVPVGALEVGGTTEISVGLITPEVGGNYRGTWRLTDGDGRAFGENLTVVIRARGSGPKIRIVRVNKDAEYVDIVNEGDEAQNLSGWVLVSERGNQRCRLGGVIKPGGELRIYADSGVNSETDYYCHFGTTIWNNDERDPAVLLDQVGNEVDRK